MSDSVKAPQAAREELYDVIRQDGSFEEKARRALELGADYLGADNGYLTRIDHETNHWEAIVSTDASDGPVPAGLELDLGTTYCKRTVDEGSQLALHDAENQGWTDEIAFATYGLSCYLGTTLIVDDETYGTVCFAASNPREEPFSDDETMFAELIARLLERELERDQHEKAFRRQANLSTVLNRVLRHNLRNNMVVIRGRTQIMADELGENQHSETVLRNIDELIDLGDKARELEQIVGETSTREPTAVGPLLTRVSNGVQDAYPNASITVDCEDDLTIDALDSFTQAIREVVENAAKHCGDQPTITVTAEASDETVNIHVADDGPGLSEQERVVLRDGVETPLVHGSGLGLWLVNWVVSSHDGTIEVCVTEDGTTMTISVPRSRAEDTTEPELLRSTDQYRAAFEEANDAMAITDNEGRILDANEAAGEICGLRKEALLGRSIQEFFPAEFEFETEWQAFKTGTKSTDTVTVVGEDGTEHVLEYAGTPNVVPGQHLFVSRDLTKRRAQEAELRMKTEAIDGAPIGITIADASQEDNPMVYTNDRFCELSGYDRDEVLGRNCRFMQKDCPRTEAVEDIHTAIETETAVSTTVQNRRKDGSTFWNHVTIAPIKDDDGTVQHYIGFQQDVTERREHQEALQETTDRLESIVSAVPNPIFAVDTDGEITQWNEAAETVLGYSAAEVLGRQIQSLEFIPAADQQEFEEHFQRVLAGEWISELDVQRRTKDGEEIQLRLSPILLRDANGAPTGVMVVAEHLKDRETATPTEDAV